MTAAAVFGEPAASIFQIDKGTRLRLETSEEVVVEEVVPQGTFTMLRVRAGDGSTRRMMYRSTMTVLEARDG